MQELLLLRVGHEHVPGAFDDVQPCVREDADGSPNCRSSTFSPSVLNAVVVTSFRADSRRFFMDDGTVKKIPETVMPQGLS